MRDDAIEAAIIDSATNQCQVLKGQICIEPICVAMCAHPCINVCIMHDS